MRLRPISRLISAVVVALAQGACSSVATTSPISVEQACAELAAARCALPSNCSLPDGTRGVGASVQEVYGDTATCLTREALACTNGLAAPQTANDPLAVRACVHAFMTYSCMDLFDNLPPAACAPKGPRPSGAPCTFDAQCQTGTCNGRRQDLCGTCGDPPGLGDDCSASPCARGARCLGNSNVCAALAASREPCDDTHPCDRGLSCVFAADPAAGTCQTAGTRGGVACDGRMRGCDETRGLSCAGEAGAKTCQPISLAAAGSACGPQPDGSRVACAAGSCIRSAGSDLGTCVAFASDGDPCDVVAGPGCMPPARCVTDADGAVGTCLVPTAAACAG